MNWYVMIGLHSFSLFQLERYFQRLKNPKLRVSLLRSLRLPSASPLPPTTAPSECLSTQLLGHQTYIEYMNRNCEHQMLFGGMRVAMELLCDVCGRGLVRELLWVGGVEAAVAGSTIHHLGVSSHQR